MAVHINNKKKAQATHQSRANAPRRNEEARNANKSDAKFKVSGTFDDVMARKGYYSRNGGYSGYRGL